MNTSPPPLREATLKTIDKLNASALHSWLKRARKAYSLVGLDSADTFTRIYWLLIINLVSGAEAFEIPEAMVHELINDAFSKTGREPSGLGLPND